MEKLGDVQNVTGMRIDGDAQHCVSALRWRIAQLREDHAVSGPGRRVPLAGGFVLDIRLTQDLKSFGDVFIQRKAVICAPGQNLMDRENIRLLSLEQHQ